MRINSQTVTAALTATLWALALPNFAIAGAESGGCGGHGGDARSLEFYRLGKNLANEFTTLQQHSPEEFAKLPVKFSPREFENAVESTRIVTSTEPIIFAGKPVDAKNHTEDRAPWIEIQSARWDSYSDNRFRKIEIVLHEYLGITQGLFHHGEWDHYQLSDQLLEIYTRKTVTELQVVHDLHVSAIKSAFTSAPPPGSEQIETAWSCVETSALQGDSSRFSHEDAYLFVRGAENRGTWQNGVALQGSGDSLFRQWQDQDPTATTGGTRLIKEFLRITPHGDLIVELTTDYLYANQSASISEPRRGVLSYFYCSRLGSETLKQMRFMRDSLLPILDVPHTRAFAEYQSKIHALQNSRAYRRCTKKSKNPACLKVARRLDKIKLPSESATVAAAKSNMEVINIWLNSLSMEDNRASLKPISDLFNRFVVHQEDLKSLMDLDIHPSQGDYIRLDSFFDSLKNRLPVAFDQARLTFLQEYSEIRLKWISGFMDGL